MTTVRRQPLANLLVYILVLSLGRMALAQASQPLNATVSGFGTSFVFSPPPVCPLCVETELGYLHLEDGNYIPGIVSIALPRGHTDVSALANLLDSEAPQSRRVTHFGNRFDFVVRQQVASKGNVVLTLAPWGTVFVRGGDGGRAGLAAAGQDSWGKNQVILNFLWTAAIGVSAANPRNDFLTSFDYSRTLQDRGTSWFLGFQQDDASGSDSSAIEEGFVIPFRNGQVELAAEQLSLNSSPQAQFQARVIVNWGRLFARK
jgi:hypothetical protein